jgi:uncharacterized protein involved in exopolysaccharide biosynthesis
MPQKDIAESAAIFSKAPHQEVGHGTLSTLLARSALILAGLVAALALVCVPLVLIGPSYTGRAMIKFNFVREEPSTGPRSLSTATVDAMAVVDSAARIIRSHATVNAVVTRLGLDKHPDFARGSLSWRAFAIIRSHFGFEEKVLSNQDLAEGQLIRRIAVTSDPRSYLLSISVTAGDPEWAARLANAVALEYLRGQLLQQVADSRAAAERRVSQLSSVYGIRHPAYQSELSNLEGLRLRLQALHAEPFDETLASGVIGQSFVAANEVMIPSGPNILLVLTLSALAELGLGTWLALRSKRAAANPVRPSARLATQVAADPAVAGLPNKPPQSHGLALARERALASIRNSDETQ